jgi:hypothetical protein
MSVFRETEIDWQGGTYRLTPSVGLLRQIKAAGINNLRLAHECIHGGADPSELAIPLRIFLTAAGVKVTEDECYSYLTSGDHIGIANFQLAYCQAVIPSIDLGKKLKAPEEQEAPGPKVRPKKT